MRSTVVKRVLDVAFAAVILVVAALPMLIIALLIRITIGPPVLFCQVRPGKDQEPFTLHKFRTMTDARDKDGQLLPDRERLTPLGCFLRRTSLDELPQLWNVLNGEMTLVGPRPLLIRYLPYYTERELMRFAVAPGITGWAQIHGRNVASWNERLAMDVWYVEHQSLLLDCRILLLTLSTVLTQKGTVEDSQSTMQDLDIERSGHPGVISRVSVSSG